MDFRRWLRLGGYGSAVLVVAVGVATNQVLNGKEWSLLWAVTAITLALVTKALDRWHGQPSPPGTLRLADAQGRPPRLRPCPTW